MKINIQGEEVSVRFSHKNIRVAKGEQMPKRPKNGWTEERCTTCTLESEKLGIFSTGTANVAPKDNFWREKGRKISLSRAIKGFPVEVRKAVWEQYQTWGKNRW